MNIKKVLIELTIDKVVTCKQLSDFYDTYHEDKEFTDAVDFLSRSIHVDMAQIKEELRNSEDKGSLGVLEYIQKHYPSAMLFMNLLPQEKRRFIH
ncbi:hypothetical protein AAFA95_001238 [Enterococcus faecalis]|jgi:hypothetical protein|uniref:hypothetical protein n=1 Tax=Enterococcus TaxID=1350 RepID=UPI000666F293|nr:hypothetical protein [Enterococcus faecalis]AMR96358.1 hypothetical protein A3777_12270 [Enterococcus faecalis]EGO5983783.1 hypothetical protein [Enterococcus faecalis]EGO7549719.1 hypothetical protein [Enterococcus faecalis]EGO7691669.1 hypothetical protein [Enterococcus faecalis]EGO8170475.1 hypothetical protein [Enterococcus faecalis]